jgi:hypothetical protein
LSWMKSSLPARDLCPVKSSCRGLERGDLPDKPYALINLVKQAGRSFDPNFSFFLSLRLCDKH